jgi:hypothetical protein
MRILNRPMFRTGGPIREGIMHGMRNGGRAALVGNPVYPQTGGREHHQQNLSLAEQKSLARFQADEARHKKFTYPAVMDKMADYYKKLYTGGINEFDIDMGLQISPYMSPDDIAEASFYEQTPKKFEKAFLSGEIGGTDYNTKMKALSAAARLAGKADLYRVPGATTETPGTTSRWDKTAPTLTSSQREDLAKKQQGERLKTYLDMMGYDSAKKGAMSKALIDASALVQDATTEAGSIKHADWGNLINKAIQTTSRRMEKPEQIREAVGLMMTKAELEKDVLKAKGSPQKQLAQELVDVGVYKTLAEAMAAGSKKPTFNQNMMAMTSKTEGKATGAMINTVLRGTEGEKAPKAHFKATDNVYKKFKEKMEDAGNEYQIELEFVDKMIDDKQPGDSFIIDDTLVIVNSDGTLEYRWE